MRPESVKHFSRVRVRQKFENDTERRLIAIPIILLTLKQNKFQNDRNHRAISKYWIFSVLQIASFLNFTCQFVNSIKLFIEYSFKYYSNQGFLNKLL